MKSFQLIKDYPGTNIKAGGIYTLVNGNYVDDYGNAFPANAVETNSDFFKEIPQASQPPVAEAQPVQPAPQVTDVVQEQLPPQVQPVPQPPMPQPQQMQPMPMQMPQPPAPPVQPWQPGPGDNFFSVNGDGELRMLMWQNKPEFYKILEFGNVFRTQVDAMTALREAKAVFLKVRSNPPGGIPVPVQPAQPYYPPQPPMQGYPQQPYYPPPQQYYPQQQPYYPPMPQQPQMPGDYLHAQPDRPASPPPAFTNPVVHAQEFKQG